MKFTRSIYSIGTSKLVAAMTGCASHKVCPGSGCTSEEETTAAVSAAISAHADLAPPNIIQVRTTDHVVYLDGIVSTVYQRSIAESVASRTDGVAKVVDLIAVSK